MNHTHNIQFDGAHETNSQYLNNWLCFIGGFILNFFWLPQLFNHINLEVITEYLQSPEFAIHLIKSVTGGFIPLSFKLLYDFIKRRSSSKTTKGDPNP